jgi:hypothetical protein
MIVVIRYVCYCVTVELVSFVYKILFCTQRKNTPIYLQDDPSCASLGFFVTYCWWAGRTEVVPHHVDIQSSRLVVIARGSG